MLTIKCVPTYKPEREYICHVLFEEFLGLEFQTQYEERRNWCITGENSVELLLPDVLFQTSQHQWLTPESLPLQPLVSWNFSKTDPECPLIGDKIPIIYGDLDVQTQFTNKPKNCDKSLVIPVDIFGSSFFMLSRYEEVVKKERDEHDRFAAWTSLAYQENFLDRPIVNEYLEILWAYMKKLWSELKRKKRQSRTLVSCDVDHPYLAGIKNVKRQIRQTSGDLLKRKDLKRTACGLINYLASKRGNFSFDVNYTTFDWMMNENEKAGNTMAFYFKAGQTDLQRDANYSLDEPIIEKLMRNIHARGHEIGLHPSYETYLDLEQMIKEANRLRQAMDRLGLRQDVLGSRQHYLRWKNSETAHNLDNAEIDYDSTLTFADHAGFRSGTCFAYSLYDLDERRTLKLKEQPLIVMEKSIGEKEYMGKGYGHTFVKTALCLKKMVKIYNGDFTLLWHNTSFFQNEMNTSYTEIIK